MYGADAYGVEAYAGSPDYSAVVDAALYIEFRWDGTNWVDETSRVRNWNTARGRRFELEKFVTGRATIVLDNRDRRFDPKYSAGALFGRLNPNVAVRIRAEHSGTSAYVFTGLIDRITQEYAPPNEATATVSASDVLKLLQRAEIPASVWDAEVADEFPTWWFPFDEAVGATRVYSSTSWTVYGDLRWVTTAPQLGQTSLVNRAGSGNTAIKFTDSESYVEVRDPNNATNIGVTTAAPFTIEFLVDAGRATPSHGTLTGAGVIYHQEIDDGSTIGTIIVRFFGQADGTSKIEFVIESRPSAGGASTIQLASTTGVNVADLNTHHVAVQFSSAAAGMKIFVDGVDRTSSATTWSGPTVKRVPTFSIGGQPGAQAGIGWWEGTIDEMVIYGASQLSAAQILEHYNAMKVGGQWSGDTSGARVTRILDEIGYGGARNVSSGRSTLIQTTLGGNALSYLQKVEETEAGQLYVAADGTLTFRGRNDTWNPTLVATYSDEDAATTRYTDLAYSRGDETIKNDVTVSRELGAVVNVENAASITSYGRMSASYTNLMFSTDAEAIDRANYVVNVYKDPQDRVQRLSVDPYAYPSVLFPRVISDELGTRVRVRRLPQGVGTAIVEDYVIEEIRHRWTPKRWSTEYSLSPASAVDFLKLDATSGPGLGEVRLSY